jgi:hypothetical protein
MLNESFDEFGATDVRFCAATLGYSFVIDDYGTEILVPPSVNQRRASSRATVSTATVVAKIDPTARLSVLVANPKKAGSATFERFAKYIDGATVADSLKNGVLSGDIRWDLAHGFIRIDPIN